MIHVGDIVKAHKNINDPIVLEPDHLWFVFKQESVGREQVVMTHLRNMTTGKTLKVSSAHNLFTTITK
jgi:hypothetical protein